MHSLKTLSDHDQTKWEDALPKIQWTLNSIPHTTTKVSPHELLYGFQLRPIHSDPLTRELYDNATENINFDQLKRDEVRNNASECIKQTQQKQKELFDAKFKSPNQYAKGDMVVVFREPLATGESRKLTRKYRGPYQVTDVLYGDRYRVEDFTNVDGRRRFKGVVSADHMRLVELPTTADDDYEDEVTCDEGEN